jgi:hypothetical protein
MEDIFDLDVNLHTSNIVPSSMFIDLFSSLFEEGLSSLVESSIVWLHPSLFIPFEVMFCQPTSEPSTSILSIQSIVHRLHTMSETRHASKKLRNLDYDKITILIVSFLPTTFNGDIIWKLPLLSPNNPSSTQMQGMDKKYGHAWSKVIITNIKNSFGLSFRKARCLVHLCCVNINYDCLVHYGASNEIAWVKEST